MPEFTSGTAAAQAGVNIETVCYYERRGLIPTPPRSSGNYRLYSNDAVRRVRFIKRAQDLGFTLVEIKELLTLTESTEANSPDTTTPATAIRGAQFAPSSRTVGLLQPRSVPDGLSKAHTPENVRPKSAVPATAPDPVFGPRIAS